MKTTVHAQRSVSAPAVVDVPASSIRLAARVSVVAALVAMLLRVATDVSEVAVVIAVIVVGFSLSWRATAPDHAVGRTN